MVAFVHIRHVYARISTLDATIEIGNTSATVKGAQPTKANIHFVSVFTATIGKRQRKAGKSSWVDFVWRV